MAAKKKGGKKGRRKPTTAHQLFARYVAAGMTKTDAAKKAGIKNPRSARQRGYEWMLRPDVQDLVRKELDLTTAQIRGLIQAQARGDAPTKIVMGAGARMEYDLLGARELAAKVDGMLREKVEHTGPNGGPIAVAIEVLGKLTTEELELLERIQKKASD